MDILPLLCIVSAAFTGLPIGANVLPGGPRNAAVGETVMFSTTLTPGRLNTVRWTFDGKNIISFTGVNVTGPEYEGRITLFMDTGSLELRSVAVNDSGEYSVTIFKVGASEPLDGNTRLDVHVPVSNVTVSTNSTDFLEFSSVRLSCSASGSSLSFLWLNGSSEVTASDRVQFTDQNATLTINVTRYDEGPYRCNVSNPVSEGTSDPISFTISYGPDNLNVKIWPPREYHAEGSNITLSCSADSKPPAQFMWLLNGNQLTHSTGPELNLTTVEMSQSGNYSCQAFNNETMINQTSQPSAVIVLAHVANVVVTSDPTDLLEFSSSVNLSCSASGPYLSFLWLNSSSEVTESDRVKITDGNSTLTIINVTRYDTGVFRCRVFNPVSNGTSDPVNLSISYGPENINLKISSPQEYYKEGSDIDLTCSADSKPSALIQWFLNGVLLSDTGPELRLMNIQMSQSGKYICQAFNSKTMKNQTSQPSVVSVLEPISNASVKPSTHLLFEGSSVNLTCDADGSVFTREWMKDGSALTLTVNMTLSDKNRVLSFNSLNEKDNGEYSCNVSNPLSSIEAKYTMEVNYGPRSVIIDGPSHIDFFRTLTLTCSAESRPPATFIWKQNGKQIHDSAVFTKHSTQSSNSGNYTCEATNSITGKTSSAYHELSVTGCGPGCIVGIVFGVLGSVALVAGGGFYIKKKKRTKGLSNRNTMTRTAGEGQDNTAYSASQDVNYADISIFKSKDGGTVQLGLQNNSEYAQVRVNDGAPAASSPPNDSPPAPSSPPTYDAHLQRMNRQPPQPDANGSEVYAQVRKK